MDSKDPHWKGQSRVLKVCHWCAKKQQPDLKSFQACAQCKEVIYCSKECQVASWPLHKASCKLSAQFRLKALTSENPEMAQAVANFKKWHGSHVEVLRHAVICALGLGHSPSAVDDNVLFLEVRLKVNHANLPPRRKYEPSMGFVMTMSETAEMLGRNGGTDILESSKAAHLHMKKKGGLGVATLLINTHDVIDVVKVILPSAAAAKQAQAADDWGEFWVEGLRIAVERN